MIDRLISFLVALSLAFLVWLYARSRDQETFVDQIPVQINLAQNQADNYELEVNGLPQVQVSFTGPPSRMRELRHLLQRGEIRVEETISVPDDRQNESRYIDTVRVDASDIHVPPGVTPAVVEGRNRISVTLNRLVSRRVQVRVDQTDDRVGQLAVEPANVLVHGPQEILEKPVFVSTQPLLPPTEGAGSQEVTAKQVVHLVQKIENHPVRTTPRVVTVRYTLRPRQKVYDLTDVPVRFLCPANFQLRPQFVAERAGKIAVRILGPASETPPAVVAFVDLTGGKFEPGLCDEPLRLQLPPSFQLAQDPPRSVAFELVQADQPPKTRETRGP